MNKTVRQAFGCHGHLSLILNTHTFANIDTIYRLSSDLASVKLKGDTFQLVTDLAPAVRKRVLLKFQLYSVTVILILCVCVCVCVCACVHILII